MKRTHIMDVSHAIQAIPYKWTGHVVRHNHWAHAAMI
jgi:hypothetical protein